MAVIPGLISVAFPAGTLGNLSGAASGNGSEPDIVLTAGIAGGGSAVQPLEPVRRNWGSILRRRVAILRDIRGGAEAWLFLRALVFALGVPLRLRRPWPELDRALQRRFPSVPAGDPGSDRCDRIARCVEGALEMGRPLVRPGCLTRGLTLYYFLRRAGFPVTLCFGARRREGQWVAEPGHCWLESDGEPLRERSDPRPSFVTLYRLPASEKAGEPEGRG